MRPPRVFISYSHDSPEHMERVRALADWLQAEGVDASLDQYAAQPERGWLRWMLSEVEQADYVLVIATAVYSRRLHSEASPGEQIWEGPILARELKGLSQFVPVVFSSRDMEHVPLPLRGTTCYDVSEEEGLAALYRSLAGQKGANLPRLGPSLVRSYEEAEPEHARKRTWLVPQGRNEYFTGREREFAQLARALPKGQPSAVVLSGPAGIGKTAVALEYAYRYRELYRAIFWLEAGAVSLLREGLAEVGRALDSADRNEVNLRSLALKVSEWLAANVDWLLILDDVRDPEALKTFLPERFLGHVLLTARDAMSVNLVRAERVELLPFTKEETRAYLLRRTAAEDLDFRQQEALDDLSAWLDGLPLTADLAAAHMLGRSLSFKEYLGLLEGSALEVIPGSSREGPMDTAPLPPVEPVHRGPAAERQHAAVSSSHHPTFQEAFCWGSTFLARLEDDQAYVQGIQPFEVGRWLLSLRLPPALAETYGTAPEVLILAVEGGVRGGDLHRARQALLRGDSDLDRDLLIVLDREPDLPNRLDRLFQAWGQWVPWSMADGEPPPLAELFRRHLSAYDVFERRDPVRGRQVIGRGEMVSDLHRRLLGGHAVGIFGLRKVGKTTVVRAATDDLDPVSARLSFPLPMVELVGEDRPVALVIWLDLQRVYERTQDAVCRHLVREMERRVELAGIFLPASRRRGTALGTLDLYLESVLAGCDLPLVLVLDEYDLLFEGSDGQPGIDGIDRLFHLLRAYAQQSGRLSLVFIGRDNRFLEQPELAGRPNPMLTWAVPRWLGPLVEADADDLLVRLGRRVLLEIGPKSQELARYWTGGHPLIHRQFGSALLEIARSRTTESGAVATDPICDAAVAAFLSRDVVTSMGREITHLLDARYPKAAELLWDLCDGDAGKAGEVVAAHGGFHHPDALLLRQLGLLLGGPEQPVVPEILRWYHQAVSPRAGRRTA